MKLHALAYSLSLALYACGGGSNSPATSQAPPNNAPSIKLSEAKPGGDASQNNTTDDAFSFAPIAIEQSFRQDANFKAGNQLFRTSNNGLGPILNANTCQNCHIKDGRGNPPADSNETFMSLVLGLNNDPIYGNQLQTFGLQSFNGSDINAGIAQFNGGHTAAIGEAKAFINHTTLETNYPDGESRTLLQPNYQLSNLAYGDLSHNTGFTLRIAPQMIGLGLLEAIPADDIQANVNNAELLEQGISGKAREVNDFSRKQQSLGRFGLKAAQASVLTQLVTAYKNDLGITSSLATEEPCTSAQISCIIAANQELDNAPGLVDIGDTELALVEFYSKLLAVPENRAYNSQNQQWDSDFLAGREHFYTLNCHSCHQPSWQTGTAEGSILGEVNLGTVFGQADPIEVLSNQTIWPYTDLLLHDMGGSCEAIESVDANGQQCNSPDNCIWQQKCNGLASGFDEGNITASEWRTPPLWGIGLTKTVNPQAGFMHDGRARTIEEAILWHGGEAQASKEAFMQLNASDRMVLLTFLESI